jgi:hypothetical protein
MNEPNQFDFWYAINNTRIVLLPTRRLETFGTTALNYHMVSALMDTVNKVRVREGRIQAQRPQIITPSSMSSTLLEGFGKEAERYVEWLQEHSQELRMLQYGFVISKQEVSEQVVTDTLAAVLERVEEEVRKKDDPLAAVLVGVDSPWEVSLLRMMVEISGRSFPGNVRELERHHLFGAEQGSSPVLRQEIDSEFTAASQNPALIAPLGKKLQQHGLFTEYEDRFFALVKAHRAKLG